MLLTRAEPAVVASSAKDVALLARTVVVGVIASVAAVTEMSSMKKPSLEVVEMTADRPLYRMMKRTRMILPANAARLTLRLMKAGSQRRLLKPTPLRLKTFVQVLPLSRDTSALKVVVVVANRPRS